MAVALFGMAFDSCNGAGRGAEVPPLTDARSIDETLRRVANYQLAHPVARDPRHWSMAPLYDGLIDASLATGDPKYLAAVIRAGRRIEFRLGSRTYHADGHAAGHAWLRLYLMQPEEDRDRKVLQRFVDQFNEIVGNPITADLSFKKPPPPGLHTTDRWTWADALYMSPPTIALLASAVGDRGYLQFLDSEFKYAYDALYDRDEHLFYRDATYVGLRTPSGSKVFWSRGNAWVYAGLALMLDSLPADHPTRPFYVGLLQEMSPALLRAQQPDGSWYPSLRDARHVPIPETSGTALFVLGMAWALHRDILDPASYWPAVERGWRSILDHIAADGGVTFVQPFGEAPVSFDATSRGTYGTGAVLGAGARMLRARNEARPVDPTVLFLQAQAIVDRVPDLSTVCENCRPP
jgi:rhamnogalacturonyl hydrolase YesR